MKKKTHIINRIAAVTLVAAICNIFITEYFCNLRHASEEASEHHSRLQSKEHHHSETIAEEDHHDDNDHHHEAVEHHHDDGTTAENHSHSGKPEKGGCCKTVTASFYSALNKPGNASFTFTKTILVVFAPFRVISFKNWKEPRPSELFCYKSPPPKIPDIRVFIQSFNI